MAKNKEAKVAIAMPVNGKMIAKTTHAIAALIIHSKDKVLDFLLHQSCDIVSSRTWLVNEAIKNGATHLLFVDSDMGFPADALERLLAHEKEIVGVEYNRRKFPLEGTQKPLVEGETSTTELYKAKYVGTGLLLIDLSIIPKLGLPTEEGGRHTPWFNFGRDSQGALMLGEDAWFCNVARDAGYDVWVDPTMRILHYGEYPY